ncbi:hypothetical protein [Microbacterium deminutum]|uniref:Uncharacterized protein n=1 Tax=Microbacterium deminutum TaxID=344164 RepID=A0ABP5C9B9_9MICO
MGLFSQQPEQDDEWAGIPSEPLRPESQAERLTDATPVDAAGLAVAGLGVAGLGVAGLGVAGLAGGGLEGLGGVESIVIPVAPMIEIAGDQESGEGPDGEDEDVV